MANAASLRQLLSLEEEQKKAARIARPKQGADPTADPAAKKWHVVYHSTRDGNRVSFYQQSLQTGEALVSTSDPEFFKQCRAKGPVAVGPILCPITHLPARYFDPVTAKPYRDAAAFAALRSQHAASAGPR